RSVLRPRVDDYSFAGRSRLPDDVLAETRGDDAFGVVGNDDGVRARELAGALLEQTLLRVAADGGRRFVIDAKQLLTLSEDPHLARGLAPVADGDQPDPAVLTGLRQLPS